MAIHVAQFQFSQVKSHLVPPTAISLATVETADETIAFALHCASKQQNVSLHSA